MMLAPCFTHFNKTNRRLIRSLVFGQLLWSCAIFGLWSVGTLLASDRPWVSSGFIALQLYAAAQLLLIVLRLHPENRSRGFYYFWGASLAFCIWLSNQLVVTGTWQTLVAAVKSGLLLLVATLIGAVLARYVKRLWEILPICLIMTLADFSSWLVGPTAGFSQQLQEYYRYPVGSPPLIDMLIVKLALPGVDRLIPVFGISDWIMVVFFALVAARFKINDNLFGASGLVLVQRRWSGLYLPVPVLALFVSLLLARGTGLFIPALPLIALSMLLCYAGRALLQRRIGSED